MRLKGPGDLIFCLDDCYNAADALWEGIELFIEGSYENVAKGIKKVGEFLEHLGDALIDC